MPEKWVRILEAAVERTWGPVLCFDDQGLAHPPWQEFPDTPRYSLGWRMGAGEDYWHAFHDWYGGLQGEQRRLYRETYPEPTEWSGFYEQAGQDAGMSNG